MKIKMEQNSLISFIYFNNLLNFYLTMTRVGKYNKMLKTMFQNYIIYDMHNTTLRHTYHITHIHTMLHTHNRHSKSPRCTRFRHITKLKTKLKISDPLLLAVRTLCLYNFSNFKYKFSASIHFFLPS